LNSLVPERHSPLVVHWPSVFQLGFSLLGIAALWSGAFLLIVLGLEQTLMPSSIQAGGMPFILMGTAGFLVGLLLIPSAGYAYLRLTGRAAENPLQSPPWLRPTLLIFALPLVLLVGYFISRSRLLAMLFLPPLHILAIGIPILWLAYLAVRDLPRGTPQRQWGILGSGTVLAPSLILVLEVAVLLGGLVGWVLSITGDPNGLNEIYSLAQQLEQAQRTGGSLELMVHLLAPYLRSPAVIFSAFAFGAVIVPVIEETLKPLGVWFLVGSRLKPAEGFTAGILCGAGYALAESLVLSSGGGAEWVSLVFARMGTSVVHILTSGLTGWALALAWRENRYLRLGAAYLCAVLIHGLWNGFTMIMVVASLSQVIGTPAARWLALADQLAPYGLIGLSLAGLAALLWINGRLRGGQSSSEGVV
jgi:hypothetical protein